MNGTARRFDRLAACWLALALAVGAAACDGGNTSDVIVRDSAGVRVTTSVPAERTFARVAPEPAIRLGGANPPEPERFSNIRGLHADSTGALYVVDGASGEVRIFEATGEHRVTMGGLGDGPGEFRRIRYLGGLADGSLALFDDANLRLTIIDAAGTVLRSTTLDDAAIGPIAIFAGGTLLVRERRTIPSTAIQPGMLLRDSARLSHFDPATGASERITELPGPTWVWTGRTQAPVPFTTNPATAVAGDAAHFAAGAEFRIRVFRAGRIVEAYGVDRDTRPVTGDAVDTYAAAFTRAIVDPDLRREYLSPLERTDLPAVMPGYVTILLPRDGTTWARIYDPDPLAPEVWDVFAAHRVWLGQVRLPAGFTAAAVERGRVYGVWRDDLGIEHVHAYDLVRAP